MEKEFAAETIRKAAEMSGMNTTDINGESLHGGHTLRMTGARYLYAMGVTTPGIMGLARWATDTVLRYLGDAPVKEVTKQFTNSKGEEQSKREMQNLLKKVACWTAHAKEQEDALRTQVTNMYEQLRVLALKIDQPFLVSEGGRGKLHKTLPYSGEPPPQWKAVCGWTYGFSRYERLREKPINWPEQRICTSCFNC